MVSPPRLLFIWVKMLAIPYRFLYPAIILLSTIGVYTLENNYFSVVLMAVFGLLGLMLTKLDFEPAPLLLGFILGPMLEENLRRSLLISRGDPSIFVMRPLSAILLVLALVLLASMLVPAIRHKKDQVIVESDA